VARRSNPTGDFARGCNALWVLVTGFREVRPRASRLLSLLRLALPSDEAMLASMKSA
jgi:hypothetical protein